MASPLPFWLPPKTFPFFNPFFQLTPLFKPLFSPSLLSLICLPASKISKTSAAKATSLSWWVALRQLHDPIIEWFNSHPSPPSAMLSDFFLGWTATLAHKLQIPRVTFYSSGAWVINVLDYCWLHIQSEDFRKSPVKHMAELPHSPSFTNEDLPEFISLYEDSGPQWQTLRSDWLETRTSWAGVFNTFGALEQDYLEYFKKINGDGSVFGIGPLSLIHGHNPIQDLSSDEVLKWLDGCPDDSVLYVCFGSQTQLNQQQMEALASGLEKSGTRFVWVVKTIHQTDAGSDGIPNGFEERVSDRGIVVKRWAPLVSILNHRAVGGFLSHCGWNSVLESLVGGVPIFAWGMEGDQVVNAKILVDQIGVAVRVCHGSQTVPDSDQLGKVIAESFRSDKLKAKAKALSKAAIDAISPNGSSQRDLQELASKLARLPPPTK